MSDSSTSGNSPPIDDVDEDLGEVDEICASRRKDLKSLAKYITREKEMFGVAFKTFYFGFKLFLEDRLSVHAMEEDYAEELKDYSPNADRRPRLILSLLKSDPMLLEDLYNHDMDSPNVRQERKCVINRLKDACKIIDAARGETRSDDVKTIKAELCNNFRTKADSDPFGHWSPPLEKDKSTWGFHHDGLGALLTPVGMSWDNEDDRNRLKQVGGVKWLPENWSRFMWEGREFDATDIRKGFLRGDILLKAFRAIWFGHPLRNAIETSGKDNNAKRHGLQKVTRESIAEATTICRFSLSSELKWGDSYNLEGFYFHLLDFLYDEAESGFTRELLRWWNRVMFGPPDLDADDDAGQVIPNTRDLFRKSTISAQSASQPKRTFNPIIPAESSPTRNEHRPILQPMQPSSSRATSVLSDLPESIESDSPSATVATGHNKENCAPVKKITSQPPPITRQKRKAAEMDIEIESEEEIPKKPKTRAGKGGKPRTASKKTGRK